MPAFFRHSCDESAEGGARGGPHRSPADLPMQSSTGGEIAEAEHDLYQAIDVFDVNEEITIFAKMPSMYPLVRG